ncbi:NADPH:quinone reductase [Polymorphobacter multimanifer]|uniref:NADPH:quinone reductase-like Zn-dependent oxidoreductase n=1 Tax=Polymorphobacter multimanifer TaxID=1070431 RepID=A0A841L5P9_9SPHN|nr:NADP-dependent oxidoreductase [Polymorphobacter multimanifer]MBB6227924.1 NADPH:quinone reductase-like Zn-dependent oxidoreductase [Polymorphobacter multimanifer]GGI83518.1 NADPH:quinone reductase [Polymorphobacter multimanifer]
MSLPETMRAARLTGYGPPEMLELADVPLPEIAPHNEVLIKVEAAGLNPFEAKLRRGWLAGLFPLALPHILGCDVAGTIVAKGFDVSEFEIGDRVYGLIDVMRPGAYAGFVASPSYLVRHMPANLGFAEAAAVPMAACTAWHGLINLAGLKAGQRVLIQAGAGGVGSFAIQIAKAHGAHVTTTASAASEAHVRAMGADEVFDYAAGDFRSLGRQFDVVLDVIGRETGQGCYDVIKSGGTLLVVLRGDDVEIMNREANMAKHGVTTKIVAFSAQPQILDLMRPLFESGQLRSPVGRRFKLDEIVAAHAALDAGHARGKMVLEIGG